MTFIERSTLGGTVAFDRRTEHFETLLQWMGSSHGLGYEFDAVTKCRIVTIEGQPKTVVEWHFTAWLPVDRAEIRESLANLEVQRDRRGRAAPVVDRGFPTGVD